MRLTGLSSAVAAVLAIAIALWAYGYGEQPLFADALGYYDFGRLIADVGLRAFASDYRTYGYPLVLAGIMRVVGQDVADVQQAVFLMQLGLLIGVAWIGARRVAGALRVAGIGPVTFAVTVANPFLLAYTMQVLTDLPGAVLLYLAVVLSLPRREPEPAGRVALLAACALFCAGFVVMLRPATLFAAPAIVGIWVVRAAIIRDIPWSVLPAALLAFCLPFVPQAWGNSRAYGVASPLVVSSIYGDNALWGLQYIKSATLVIPGVDNTLYYDNPLRPPPGLTVTEALRQHPAAYVATLGLHLFALVDQDFAFAYIRDVDPWYRWPLSVLSYLFFFGAFTGYLLGLRGDAQAPADRLRRQRFVLLACGVTALALVAFYLPTKVESRYGLPLYLLFAPAFALAAVRLYAAAPTIRRLRWSLGVLAATTWVCAAASGSVWVQRQAPLLLALRAGHTTTVAAAVPGTDQTAAPSTAPVSSALSAPAPGQPTPEIPSARYAVELPRAMTISTGTEFDVTVTNTGDQTWNVQAPHQVAIAARFIAQNTALHRRVQGLMKDSQSVALPNDVPPGASTTVRLRVLPPPVPGRYTLLVHVTRVGVPDSATNATRVVRVEDGW